MTITSIRSFFPIVILAVLTLACSNDKPSPSDGVSGDSSLLPDSDLLDATIYLYDGGEISTEIIADKIVKFEKQDSTVAYNLNVDIYDSLGQVSTNIVGDSGVIRELRNQLYIYGDVIVESDSTKLETDFLFWNSHTDMVETDSYVKITQGNDVMTGYGLQADQNLNRIKILRQASGTIHDTKKLQDQ